MVTKKQVHSASFSSWTWTGEVDSPNTERETTSTNPTWWVTNQKAETPGYGAVQEIQGQTERKPWLTVKKHRQKKRRPAHCCRIVHCEAIRLSSNLEVTIIHKNFPFRSNQLMTLTEYCFDDNKKMKGGEEVRKDACARTTECINYSPECSSVSGLGLRDARVEYESIRSDRVLHVPPIDSYWFISHPVECNKWQAMVHPTSTLLSSSSPSYIHFLCQEVSITRAWNDEGSKYVCCTSTRE